MTLLSTAIREHVECPTCHRSYEFQSCTMTGRSLQRCGCSPRWYPVPRVVGVPMVRERRAPATPKVDAPKMVKPPLVAKRCALDTCRRIFTPKRRNYDTPYCCGSCRDTDRYRQRTAARDVERNAVAAQIPEGVPMPSKMTLSLAKKRPKLLAFLAMSRAEVEALYVECRGLARLAHRVGVNVATAHKRCRELGIVTCDWRQRRRTR